MCARARAADGVVCARGRDRVATRRVAIGLAIPGHERLLLGEAPARGRIAVLVTHVTSARAPILDRVGHGHVHDDEMTRRDFLETVFTVGFFRASRA